MSITGKLQKRLDEFRQADCKTCWLYDQWRWRYFTFRHKKQARLNLVFDREHRVETAAEAALESVGVPQADVARGNGVYRPLTESLFRSALGALHADLSKFTFVDIGSGKGKVLFMAADLPFKSIIGIEYAAGLHEVAVRNVATYKAKTQRCHAIVALHGDALEYAAPAGPLLLFTFNALEKNTMRKLLTKVDADAAADPARPIVLIYTNLRTVDELGSAFSDLPNLKVIRRMRNFVVAASPAAAAMVK